MAFDGRMDMGLSRYGQSQVTVVKKYIAAPRGTSSKGIFQEELRRFLERYQVKYDDRYVWDETWVTAFHRQAGNGGELFVRPVARNPASAFGSLGLRRRSAAFAGKTGVLTNETEDCGNPDCVPDRRNDARYESDASWNGLPASQRVNFVRSRQSAADAKPLRRMGRHQATVPGWEIKFDCWAFPDSHATKQSKGLHDIFLPDLETQPSCAQLECLRRMS